MSYLREYDGQGRLAQANRGSRVYATRSSADGWGDATTATEDLGATYQVRDGNGRPLAVTLPGGRTVEFAYDP